MKTNLLLVFFLALAIGAMGQGSSPFISTWQLLDSDDKVSIYQKSEFFNDYTNDINAVYRVLKFVNKTEKSIAVGFDYEKAYDGQFVIINDENRNEMSTKLTLSPKQVLVSSAYVPNHKELVVFDRLSDFHSSALTHIGVANLQSTFIQ